MEIPNVNINFVFMKEVKTCNGYIAMINNRDYDIVNKYSWYHLYAKNTTYCRTYAIYNGTKRWFYMHQLILGTVGSLLIIG